MGFAQENGYVPNDIETIISEFRENINTQFGTTYTVESFLGTNFYKYFYALAQRVQKNEIKTSEIFQKLQVYITLINESISRPVNTSPGIVEKLEAEGYIASVKPMVDADAGKVHICIDTDEEAEDYDDIKLALCTLISQITVGGSVTQGTETEAIVLSNGQSFDFKYNLPNRIPTWLRLTITLSENNMVVVGSPDDTKLLLLNNVLSLYRLGRNFEPQRYFSVLNAPWASEVHLEYSFDYDPDEPESATWLDEIYDADYDDLLEVSLETIILEEA